VARQDLPFLGRAAAGDVGWGPPAPVGAGAVVSRHGCDTDAANGSAQ
jgi:hypothetical protein